jgi:hypothetical protein
MRGVFSFARPPLGAAAAVYWARVKLGSVTHEAKYRSAEALRKRLAMCSGFSEVERRHEGGAVDEIYKSEERKNDKFVILSNALGEASRAAHDARNTDRSAAYLEYLNHTRAMLRTRDPLLIYRAALYRADRGSYFEGQFYSVDLRKFNGLVTPFDAAAKLAACYLGDRCGEDDHEVNYYCVVLAVCTKSREELMRTQLAHAGISEAGFQQVVAMSQRMHAAVMAERAESFVPPLSEFTAR